MSSLMDFILKNRHFLEEFGNSLDLEIINSLRASQLEILKKLKSKPWINEISRSHYKYVLAQTIDILKQVHKDIDEKILDSLGDVAKLEYFNVANALLKQEGLDLISRSVPNLGLPAKALRRILKPKLGDFLLSDLFNKSFKNHLKNSKRILLNGLIQGQSMQTIAKNIQRATNLSIIESTRIARTAIIDASNKSLQEVYEKYDEFIIAYRWIATLDHRTCLLCGHFDGVAHQDVITFGITPPAHFLCRCILMSLTKYDLEGIERPYKKIISKRVTRTGKIKYEIKYGKTEASEKYRDWFKRQNELFKKEVLRPTRYAAYKKGELNFENFSDIKSGRILTINQLSEKYDIDFKELLKKQS